MSHKVVSRDASLLLMLLPSVVSASPAPGGVERPRPRRLTKSAIVVVKDSESDIEGPVVKQEPKASVQRGRVLARRTVSVKGEKHVALRPVSGKVHPRQPFSIY